MTETTELWANGQVVRTVRHVNDLTSAQLVANVHQQMADLKAGGIAIGAFPDRLVDRPAPWRPAPFRGQRWAFDLSQGYAKGTWLPIGVVLGTLGVAGDNAAMAANGLLIIALWMVTNRRRRLRS